MTSNSLVAAITEDEVKDWRSARSLLLSLAVENRSRDSDSDARLNHFVRGRRWIYRGVRDSTWALESSFQRYWGESFPSVARGRIHKSQLEELRSAVVTYVPDFPHKDDDAELEAFGQHYGLPTLLLDWSRNPLVAAYFACSDALLSGADVASKLAVWALRTDSPVWNDQQGCVEIVTSVGAANARAAHQMGLFTYDRSGRATLEDYVRASLDDAVVQQDLRERGAILRKVTFPHAVVFDALEELDLFNINSFSMFPDHQGLVRGARERLIRSTLKSREVREPRRTGSVTDPE